MQHDEALKHDCVLHSHGQFVKGEGLTPVSINAVEGFFRRTKTHICICRCAKVYKIEYESFLGEFLWRERFLSERAFGVKSGGNMLSGVSWM